MLGRIRNYEGDACASLREKAPALPGPITWLLAPSSPRRASRVHCVGLRPPLTPAYYVKSPTQTRGVPLFGGRRLFTPDLLQTLYSDRGAYLRRWDSAIRAMVASETLLLEDAKRLKDRGRDIATSLPLDAA